MIRNLKTLGLALVAMLAMSVVAASAAQAEAQLDTDIEGATVSLLGNQVGEHVFEANGNEVTCKKASFTGTATDGATELTIAPSYSECHIIFLFTFNANVNTNGCDYTFTTASTGGPEWQGAVDVVGCNAGTAGIVINVPAAGCSVTVPQQNGLNTVDYDSKAGAPDDVDVNATVGGISFTSTGGLCGANGNNGTYAGLTKVKGTNTGSGLAEGIRMVH